MSKLVLPKEYLSYSAMELWLRDKAAYRQRYYEGEPYFSTPYTDFGNEIGGALEDRNWDHPAIAPVKGKVPQLTSPEHKLEVEIGGVPILGFLDDFDPETLAILEYKTGIKSKGGAAPWDRLKVRKHKQLPIYCMLVRKKYGSYNPDIKLVWMETKWSTIEKTRKFGSKEFVTQEPGLKLTGHVEIFDRNIKEWELDRQEEIIRRIAEEISEDYKLWKTKK